MNKVLLVEDGMNIVELLTIHLKDLSCDVTTINDWHKGLKAAKDQSFDLIILDIMLPGMNGMEVCRRIRQTDIRPSSFYLSNQKR